MNDRPQERPAAPSPRALAEAIVNLDNRLKVVEEMLTRAVAKEPEIVVPKDLYRR